MAASHQQSVLQKAQSESYSEQDYERFHRIESRFSRINQAKLDARIKKFRDTGEEMSYAALLKEKHNSTKLGKNLRADGQPRPGARWEAHHIISGAHPEAALARTVLADDPIKMRIDDPDNGCWMPKTKADARPTMYPNAIGHNRIHRERYYHWLFSRIQFLDDKKLLVSVLRTVRAQLMHGNIADELLEQEIDQAELKDWLKKNA